MKKIIIPAFVSLITLASTSALASESDYYFKGNISYAKFDKVKSINSKNDYAIGFGVGYNYLDNVRLDLTFEHFFNPKFKSGNKTISGDVNTLLLNGFVDVADISIAKIFVGGGAGFGRTKATVRGDSVAANNGKAGQQYSLAYALYLGSAVEFAPGMTAELTYSYRSMGETKELNDSSIKFRGQVVSAGIRLDF